jgi:hypothetical protein
VLERFKPLYLFERGSRRERRGPSRHNEGHDDRTGPGTAGIPNRTARTALPVDVTKATGLQRALRDIGTTAAHTVGVGDAENDVAFLRICGLAAAVSNALTCVRATADIVTEEARGAGVARLIDWWLTGESGAIGRSVPGSVRDARRRPR